MLDEKVDFEKAITHGLNLWIEAKKKMYKYSRIIGDIGDFSFVSGQWQK